MSVTFDDDTGLVTAFEAPSGVAPISASADGYALCTDIGTHGFTIGPGVYDYNWDGVATKSQPGGANTWPVTYTRTNASGAISMAIEYTGIHGERVLRIKMTITNNAGIQLDGVKVSRILGPHQTEPIVWDTTPDTVGARLDDPAPRIGIQMTNLHRNVTLATSMEHFTTVPGSAPFAGACDVTTPVATPVLNYTGGAGRLDYSLGSLPDGSSTHVRFQYRRY